MARWHQIGGSGRGGISGSSSCLPRATRGSAASAAGAAASSRSSRCSSRRSSSSSSPPPRSPAAAILDSTCSLDDLRPLSLGVELVPLRRQRQPPRRRPVGDEPSAAAALEDVAVAPAGDRRDRGRALLAARRARHPGHRARALDRPDERPDRAGRLDALAAARPQPLHRQPAEDVLPEDQGGVPRGQALRADAGQVRAERAEADSRRVPQRGVLRPSRVRRRGRGGDVLLEERLQAQPPPSCAHRRPAAGADDVRPARQPPVRPRSAQRRAAGDAEERLHHPRAVQDRPEETARAQAGAPLHDAPAAELLRLGDAAAPRRATAGRRSSAAG